MVDPIIKELILKELKNELGNGDPLTPGERQVLDTWMTESDENRRWYNLMRDPRHLASSMEALEKGASYQEQDIKAFMTGMDRIDARNHRPHTPHFRFPYFKLVAAATVVIAVISGAYHFWGPTFTGGGTMNGIPGDALPGANRAILKRANGVHIDLGSASSRKIADGQANIEKLDSTQIAYITPVLKHDGRPVEVEYDTIVTPRGGQYKVILPDGSKVFLNASSSIRFPTTFSASSREVTLTGEAYFEIAKQSGAAFTVNVQHMKVNVLGTRFGIADYAEDGAIKTTLIEGAIKIQTPSASQILQPGQQAVVSSNGIGDISLRRLDDPEATVAYANGMFEFDRDSITTVMNQLSRWYSLDVVYSSMPRKTFTGSLSRKKNAADILKVLQASGGVKFKIEGSQIFVQP